MENNFNSTTEQGRDMHLDTKTAGVLAEGAKWAGRMAVIMYVLIGLMIIGLLGILMSGAPGAVMLAVAYALLVVLYIVFARLLGKFKTNTIKAVAEADGSKLIGGIEPLRDFFKFSVIITLVAIGLGLLFGIIMAVSGVSMMM